MKKIVSKNKEDWHEKMQEANWAYRTTVRTPTQMPPYSLVFGGEAVLPIELEHPSLRVAVHEKLTEEEQMKLRLAELESLEGQTKTDSPTEPRAVSHSNGKILQLFGSRTSVKAR